MFVTFLVDACFKSKFKHGCEVWDTFSKTELTTMNKSVPNTFKRILQLPCSTPISIVKHDMGIIDLDLEVAMERIILASKILQLDEIRISKRLLSSMMELKVPGFCSTLEDSLKLLNIENIHELDKVKDTRKSIKMMVIEVQRNRIIEDMLKGSKADQILKHFAFDGHMKRYLFELPFDEARMIFMWRARMFPTKCNFPERWSSSKLCNFCCRLGTDKNLLNCCGYMDITHGKVNPDIFWSVNKDEVDDLRFGAQILKEIYDRLLVTNEDKDLNDHVK